MKVPWELGRCQHLVTLAQAFGIKRNQQYAEEYRNQILDFIATNPPSFGIQWRCPMDVAIRVSNWLLAHDLFGSCGHFFDDEFESWLINSVYDHGKYIAGHLEWAPEKRGNHYLANIVGLLFVAAYLPCNPEVDAWLAFAVSELGKETEHQFESDGGNFEGSSCYHRLSAEMVIFGTALALGLPPDKQAALQEYDHRLMRRGPKLAPAPLPTYSGIIEGRQSPFPTEHFEQLHRIIAFTKSVTKPNGKIHQIGDNDSGRFFKLDVAFERLTVAQARARFQNLTEYRELPDDAVYWWEDPLDHRSLVDAWRGFLAADHSQTPARVSTWGAAAIRSFLKQRTLAGAARKTAAASRCVQADLHHQTWDQAISTLEADTSLRTFEGVIEFDTPFWFQQLLFQAFPDFGIYIWRDSRTYLAIRCGRLTKRNAGGHAHCDQLAIELQVDGRDLLVDPGTYAYTPDRRSRNLYRSVSVHRAPQTVAGREPNKLNGNLFALKDTAQAECLYAGPRGFIGRHYGFGQCVHRVVEFADNNLRIIDLAPPSLQLQSPSSFAIDAPLEALLPFSPGYGLRERQS